MMTTTSRTVLGCSISRLGKGQLWSWHEIVLWMLKNNQMWAWMLKSKHMKFNTDEMLIIKHEFFIEAATLAPNMLSTSKPCFTLCLAIQINQHTLKTTWVWKLERQDSMSILALMIKYEFSKTYSTLILLLDEPVRVTEELYKLNQDYQWLKHLHWPSSAY